MVDVSLGPLAEWSGSGSVVYSSPSRSLVLTAAHVCATEKKLAPFNFLKKITVKQVRGAEIPAEVVRMDRLEDTCVLKVAGYLGPAVVIADKLPELGEVVYYPGVPLGLFGSGVGFLGQGRYAGYPTEPMEGSRRILIDGVSTHGASGSGIFYRGRLIGLLIAIGSDGGYVVVGAPLVAVQKAVEAAVAALPKA